MRSKAGPQISCAVTALSGVLVSNDPKGSVRLHPVSAVIAEIATVLGPDYVHSIFLNCESKDIILLWVLKMLKCLSVALQIALFYLSFLWILVWVFFFFQSNSGHKRQNQYFVTCKNGTYVCEESQGCKEKIQLLTPLHEIIWYFVTDFMYWSLNRFTCFNGFFFSQSSTFPFLSKKQTKPNHHKPPPPNKQKPTPKKKSPNKNKHRKKSRICFWGFFFAFFWFCLFISLLHGDLVWFGFFLMCLGDTYWKEQHFCRMKDL